MDTPLLPSETVPPSLSSGPVLLEEEESEFSRLIALRSPSSHHPSVPPTNTNESSRDVGPVQRGARDIILAGSFCLGHVGLVWGSYMSPVWNQTYIRVNIDWQTNFLPWLNLEKNIRQLNLAQLLQDLSVTSQNTLLAVLWLTSLFIPCIFMVLSPTLILSDYQQGVLMDQRRRCWSVRNMLEGSLRFCWMTVFVLVLLGMATSSIAVVWTGTDIRVGNRAQAPLGAYTAGIVCAILATMVLRSPNTEEKQRQGIFTTEDSIPRSPPPHAFRFPWPRVEEEDDEASMVVLEETPMRPMPSTPDRVAEDRPTATLEPPNILYWQRILVFQVGLLSILMLIPSLYLPYLHVSYDGLASDFMMNPSFPVYLWELPATLWRLNRHSGTQMWITVLIGFVLILSLLVVPVVLTCLAVLAWLADEPWSTRAHYYVYMLHPAAGGLVMSVAAIATTRAMYPMIDHWLTQSSFCESVLGDGPCLQVHGHILAGAWSYFVQSILLEIFVITTLQWK